MRYCFFYSVILSVFGFLVVCGTLYELRQQFIADKGDASNTINRKNDHYDVIGKVPQNNYASLNKAFVIEESKSNGDVKQQNGSGGIQNGNTITELPAGYMQHKEDDNLNPAGVSNKKNGEVDTSHYVTVTVNKKPQSETKLNAIQKKNGKASWFSACQHCFILTI